MDLPYDPIETLRNDGRAFIDLVAAHDPASSVPACPDWTLADLAYHQGEVWEFWSQVVATGVTERGQLQHLERSSRPDDAVLVGWAGERLDQLEAALTGSSSDQQVWTWTGSNQPVSWVQRRMAQETAVHLVDAAGATSGTHTIPTAVAADGIDEFLMWFAGTDRRDGELKPGGTVHLHCTDTTEADTAGGEWFISSLKAPVCTFTREHRKGDAAVRGTAHALLMWLWRRSTDGVEVIGDDKVARRFRAYTDLS